LSLYLDVLEKYVCVGRAICPPPLGIFPFLVILCLQRMREQVVCRGRSRRLPHET
jgi:hypothetical protein